MADGTTFYNDPVGGENGQSPIKEDLWSNFAKPLINFNTFVICDTLEFVARQVLDAYNIPFDATLPGAISDSAYGRLPDYDIKKMDATTALNYSLMEAAFKSGAAGNFIEPIVDEYGSVNFVEIGSQTSQISDVYYSVQTGTYVEEPKAVMVMGGKPIPTFKPTEWKAVWQAEGEFGADIFAAGDMLGNCMDPNWKSHATIVFKNPQLNTTFEDGLENLYEIDASNPWDRVAGYAVYVEPPEDRVTPQTTIAYAEDADIPLLISSEVDGICNIGKKLYTQPQREPTEDEVCWADMTGNQVVYDDGIPVEIPEKFRFSSLRGTKVDNFVQITGVYVIGYKIDSLYARPLSKDKALEDMTDENSQIWVSINTVRRTSYKLDEKKHYAVAYADVDADEYQEISICLAKEPRPYDRVTYGNGPDGTGTEFYLDPLCLFADVNAGEFAGGGPFKRTIIPWGLTQGILVEEIWVSVKVAMPSVSIYDPDGQNNRALDIATYLKYYVKPLVLVEPPSPVGFAANGESYVIDQVPEIRDNDPTTQQDFTDTPMEQAMDKMSGSGFQITFGFLTGPAIAGQDAGDVYNSAGEEARRAAEIIYDYMNDDVVETVYTCGPDCRPELGTKGPAGGIVNSIKYNYSDQSSYTISVTEGPKIIGNLTSIDGGPSQKAIEEVGGKGTVLQALGDNLHFKVRIDGYGNRWAVNMSKEIVREGDVVNVTIHNNPVEA